MLDTWVLDTWVLSHLGWKLLIRPTESSLPTTTGSAVKKSKKRKVKTEVEVEAKSEDDPDTEKVSGAPSPRAEPSLAY